MRRIGRADAKRRARKREKLLQRCDVEQVLVGILLSDPPLEHHAARAGHGQAIAVRRGLRRVARHPTVRAVISDELLKVGEQNHGRRSPLHSASAPPDHCSRLRAPARVQHPARSTRLMRSRDAETGVAHRLGRARWSGTARAGHAERVTWSCLPSGSLGDANRRPGLLASGMRHNPLDPGEPPCPTSLPFERKPEK
jgi:hypothetical protein